MEVFAKDELKLVETIQKPLSTNLKHKPAIENKTARKPKIVNL
jgi:hypothetical protein